MQRVIFSGILLAILNGCISVTPPENLALLATATCKDKPAANVNDGDFTTDWDGKSRNIWYGWIDYPTLEMKWDTPQLENKIVLYDRSSLSEHLADCTIRFSHEGEVMEPGYHKLYLDRYKVQVEYTATERVAFYRMKYDEAARAGLLLQLGGFVGAASYVDGDVKLVSPKRLEGSHGMTDRLWGGPKLTHVFFVMEFDRPVDRMDAWKGQDRKLTDVKAFADPVKPERIQKGYFGNLKGRLFVNHPEDQAGVNLGYDVKSGDEARSI